MFDLFGFVLRSGEPKQDVVCVPEVAKPPVVRTIWIQCRKTALLLAQFRNTA